MKDKLRELAERWKNRDYDDMEHLQWYAMGIRQARDELLEILDSEGDGGAVEVCIPFGEGKVVVTTGTHGGMPCVFLAPASIPGVVGESAARENLPSDRRIAGESVLTFPTAEQASLVANTLCGKNTHPARSGVVSDEDVRDVERYRWLRDGGISNSNLLHVISDDYSPPFKEMKFGKDLDAAIDAAIQGERHER